MNKIDLDYFNGLSIKEIFLLAKKSIQLSSENSRLIGLLDEVYNCENINKKLREEIKKELAQYE